MEFMAVEKGMGFKGETSIKRELIDLNITTNLDSECWKPASQQHPPREKRGHYLSRVKPQMMQQVLSFKGSFDERKACISSHGHVKGSGVGETMELFPQHTRFGTAKPINANTCFSPASVHHRHLAGQGPSGVGGARPTSARSVPPATTALKQSSTELTVFYNGTVNVYDVPADKAEAILNMLAGNGNSHQSNPDPNFDERAVCSTPSGSSNIPRISKAKSIGAPNEVPATLPIPKQTAIAESINEIIKLRKAAAELPLARKQSLQRFLEKRQTRLNGVAPYPTSGSLPKKAVEDKMRAPLLLSSKMECAIPL